MKKIKLYVKQNGIYYNKSFNVSDIRSIDIQFIKGGYIRMFITFDFFSTIELISELSEIYDVLEENKIEYRECVFNEFDKEYYNKSLLPTLKTTYSFLIDKNIKIINN